jgi:hypothetical protein
MMHCPVCKTEYEPRDGDCPSCGPMPTVPSKLHTSSGIHVPDFDQPGVAERVAAEAEYMARIHDLYGRRK